MSSQNSIAYQFKKNCILKLKLKFLIYIYLKENKNGLFLIF